MASFYKFDYWVKTPNGFFQVVCLAFYKQLNDYYLPLVLPSDLQPDSAITATTHGSYGKIAEAL